MKKTFFLLLCATLSLSLSAQGIKNPAQWSVEAKRISATQAELHFTADIESKWVVYGVNVPEDGPLPITLSLESGKAEGALVEITKSEVKHDEMFDMDVPYFAKKAHLMQLVDIAEDQNKICGIVEYQACSAMECIPLEHDFSVEIPAKIAAASATSDGNEMSIGMLILLAIGAGIVGVLMPCVFPMIPMTISFFIRGKSRKTSLVQVMIFGISVVLIYTAVGVIAAIAKSADFANVISVHWIPNLIFFALFIIFAASFFGAFEITLPSNITTNIDKQADKGGYFSAFFVALALCVVSFACTGPFVGGLLVAAARGDIMYPIIGLFWYGVAFALPFVLLGVFPSAIKKLPRSGGWMNTLKVFFAFIMAIFSMKFLSVADQALGYNIISRELFICIWVVLFALLGVYFLGKIQFNHDDELKKIGFTRFLLAIVSFVFALYLFTGLLGNPLNSLSGFLPAKSVKKHTVIAQKSISQNALCGPAKYADNENFHGLADLPTYFDLTEAQACAKQQNKSLLIAFKGIYCANCKKMEGEIFSDSEIQQLLSEKFVIVALYTDDKTKLPEDAWYTSTFDGKVKKTIGEQNMDYMITKYNVNAIPYFAMLNSNGNEVGAPIGYTASTEKFTEFLKQKE